MIDNLTPLYFPTLVEIKDVQESLEIFDIIFEKLPYFISNPIYLKNIQIILIQNVSFIDIQLNFSEYTSNSFAALITIEQNIENYLYSLNINQVKILKNRLNNMQLFQIKMASNMNISAYINDLTIEDSIFQECYLFKTTNYNIVLFNLTKFSMFNNSIEFKTESPDYFISGFNIILQSINISNNSFSHGSFLYITIILKESGSTEPNFNPFPVIDTAFFTGNVYDFYDNSLHIIYFSSLIITNLVGSMQKFVFLNMFVINETFKHKISSVNFFYLPSQAIFWVKFSNISCFNSKEIAWFFIENLANIELSNIILEREKNYSIANIPAYIVIYMTNFYNVNVNNISLKYFLSTTPLVYLEIFDSLFIVSKVSISNSSFTNNYLKPLSYAVISIIKLTSDSAFLVLFESNTFESNFLDVSSYTYMESTSVIYINFDALNAQVDIISSEISNNSPTNLYINCDIINFSNNFFRNAKYSLPDYFIHYFTEVTMDQMLAISQSAFAWIYYSSINIMNSSFSESNNGNAGSLLLKSNTQNSQMINILNCSFSNLISNADGGALIFELEDNKDYHITINNSNFMNILSYNKGGSIFFDGNCKEVEMNIVDTNFTDSISKLAGSILYIEKGQFIEILLNNVFITNQETPLSMGNLFQLSLDSSEAYLIINNLVVSNIVCDCSFVYQTATSFSIVNSTFENNVFGSKGLIYLENVLENVFMSTIFRKNVHKTDTAQLPNDLSSFWNFTYYESSVVRIIAKNSDAVISTIIFEECFFSDNVCDSCLGGGIALSINSNFEELLIKSCEFNNNSANVGGAIYFYQSEVNLTFARIILCNFKGNSASYFAGALYLSNGFVNLSDLNFEDNYLKGVKKSEYFIKNNSSYKEYDYSFIQNKGGAIFYEGSSETTDIYIESCNFLNNSAGIGGAIYYLSSLMHEKSLSFKNNIASFYGNNIYYTPFHLKLVKNPFNNLFETIENNSILEGFRSGNSISELIFQLFDEDNEIIDIFEENIDVKIYCKSENSTEISQMSSIKGNTLATLNKTFGGFFFNSLIFMGNREGTYEIIVNTTAIKTEENFFVLRIKFRNCIVGEIYDSVLNTCEECGENFYSLEENATYCKSCEQNSMSRCYKNIIIIRPFWWRKNNLTDKVIECKLAKNLCLGDTQEIQKEIRCYAGHIGAFCQSCDIYGKYWTEKWAKKSKFSCGKCSDIQFNISILITLLIFNVLSIAVSVKGVVSMIDTEVQARTFRRMGFLFLKTKSKKTSIYLKILMTYVQIVSSISSFDLTLPPEINILPDTVGNPTETLLFSTDCFVVQLIKTPSYIYIKAIITFLMPLIYLFLFFLFYYLLVLLKIVRNRPQIFYTASFFVVIYLQPNILSILISVISCQSVTDGLYIKADLAYECYTNEHVFYSLVFSLPALLIWAFFIPLFIFWRLFNARKKLDFVKNRIKYGFLYSEYKPNAFYWEFIKMFEKLCIIVFLSFFESEKMIKGMLILLVIFLYFLLLLYMNPYKTDELNRIDIASNIVCYLTIFFAILAYNNPFVSFLYISYSIILISNGLFILIVGKKLLKSMFLDKSTDFENIKYYLKKFLPFCFFWIKKKKIYRTLPLWRKVRRAVLRYLKEKHKKINNNNYFKKRTMLDKNVVKKVREFGNWETGSPKFTFKTFNVNRMKTWESEPNTFKEKKQEKCNRFCEFFVLFCEFFCFVL